MSTRAQMMGATVFALGVASMWWGLKALSVIEVFTCGDETCEEAHP